MFLRRLACILVVISIQCQTEVQGIWFPWYFYRYASRYDDGCGGGSGSGGGGSGGATCGGSNPSSTKKGGTQKPCYQMPTTPRPTHGCPPGMRPINGTTSLNEMPLCDDNPVLMQLARLYIVSPERIVLLLSEPSIEKSCTFIDDVLSRINGCTRNCRLADDNIYHKLTMGLDYFKKEICDENDSTQTRKRRTALSDAHSCLRELRADMIECEAPADWYERRNATKVCQSLNDIINCYYTRAAMLCGLEVARNLRSFAGDAMAKSLIHNCQISSRLPRVDDPMPISGSHLMSPSMQYLMLDENHLP